jgi:hypothetical protein
MLLKSNPLSQSSFLRLLLAFVDLFLLAANLPLLIKADISVDDWGDISHTLVCNSFGSVINLGFPYFRAAL